MTKDIPQITFNPTIGNNIGIEIIPIQKIAEEKKKYDHHPEMPHLLKFYNLIFFTAGKGKHFIDFEWYKVKKNTLLYLSKEQINAFDFAKGLKGFCIVFTEQFLIECFPNLSKGFVFRLFSPQLYSPLLQIPSSSDFETYLNLLKKEMETNISENQKIIVQSLFAVLVSKAEILKQNQTLHINDTLKIVTYHKFVALFEKNITISRSAKFYAKKLNITYKHLNVICKELLNKTAKKVIDDYLILQAKRSLINISISSKELAYKLGFEDPTNFSKYFKKHTGFTPNAFIKSYSK